MSAESECAACNKVMSTGDCPYDDSFGNHICRKCIDLCYKKLNDLRRNFRRNTLYCEDNI